ncbi:hypothetical protein [Shewanella sp. UCD-KL12]|uniref:hypothetical protein n=1 Tax=Shewanella sp. UCD-KL12 TaxID=1917163 RepID=UPI0009703DA6|nr:hypothetical protein [Shewanella sp. UCD-KL12]
MWWRILIISLAFILIGAHFLRFGYTITCAVFALAPLLLFIRHKIATRLLQIALLVCAVLVWGVSGFEYVQMRIGMEQPWLRLALIMSGVVAFTLLAAACCNGVIHNRLTAKSIN